MTDDERDAAVCDFLHVSHPFDSHLFVRAIEDAMRRRGLHYTYLNRLSDLVADGCLSLDDRTGQPYDDPEIDTPPRALDGDALWALMCATPDQRRVAALRACGVKL